MALQSKEKWILKRIGCSQRVERCEVPEGMICKVLIAYNLEWMKFEKNYSKKIDENTTKKMYHSWKSDRLDKNAF